MCGCVFMTITATTAKFPVLDILLQRRALCVVVGATYCSVTNPQVHRLCVGWHAFRWGPHSAPAYHVLTRATMRPPEPFVGGTRAPRDSLWGVGGA